MVQLHLNGKRKCDIIREYDISGALLDKWIKQSTTIEKDNRSEMEQEGLVSNYTVAQYKPHVDKCNESQIANVVNRQFKKQPECNVVVSDLTSKVKVNLKQIKIFPTDRANEFKNKLIDETLESFQIQRSLIFGRTQS